MNPATFAVNYNQLGIINLVQNIPRGTDKGQRVGDQIFLKGIKMKYVLIPTNYEDATTVSMALLWTKQNLSAVGTVTYNLIFENVTGDPRLDVIDTEKVKLLWRKDHLIKPHNVSQYIELNYSKWLPINRNHKFFTDTDTQFTTGQYYLVLWAASSAVSGKIADVKSLMYTYYKDA